MPTHNPADINAALFAAARAIIARVAAEPQTGPVYVEISNRSGTRLHLVSDKPPSGQLLSAAEPTPGQPPSATGALRAAFLSPYEREVVRAIGTRALKGEQVSKALKETGMSTRLRTCLANLVDRGVLLKTDDGYRVAEPSFLEVAQDGDAQPTGGAPSAA